MSNAVFVIKLGEMHLGKIINGEANIIDCDIKTGQIELSKIRAIDRPYSMVIPHNENTNTALQSLSAHKDLPGWQSIRQAFESAKISNTQMFSVNDQLRGKLFTYWQDMNDVDVNDEQLNKAKFNHLKL